jgi:hypothetical protein
VTRPVTCMSSPFCKNILIFRRPKSVYNPAVPSHRGGGSRSSRTRGGMRWTLMAPLTNRARGGRRSRVVLTPRRWCQAGGVIRRRRWQTSPVTGESTKETVKTIARGMPGDSGVTVVTCSCAFFIRTRGCGCIERPAFPAPSDWRVRKFLANLGRVTPRDREVVSANNVAVLIN